MVIKIMANFVLVLSSCVTKNIFKNNRILLMETSINSKKVLTRDKVSL